MSTPRLSAGEIGGTAFGMCGALVLTIGGRSDTGATLVGDLVCGASVFGVIAYISLGRRLRTWIPLFAYMFTISGKLSGIACMQRDREHARALPHADWPDPRHSVSFTRLLSCVRTCNAAMCPASFDCLGQSTMPTGGKLVATSYGHAGCAALLLSITAVFVEGARLWQLGTEGVFGWLSLSYLGPVTAIAAGPGVIGHTGFNALLRWMPLPAQAAMAWQRI